MHAIKARARTVRSIYFFKNEWHASLKTHKHYYHCTQLNILEMWDSLFKYYFSNLYIVDIRGILIATGVMCLQVIPKTLQIWLYLYFLFLLFWKRSSLFTLMWHHILFINRKGKALITKWPTTSQRTLRTTPRIIKT